MMRSEGESSTAELSVMQSDRLQSSGVGRSIFVFAARRQRASLVLALVVMVAVLFSALCWGGWSGFWNVVDPTLTLATFATAVIVWMSEARQDWERSRPLQVTAEFRLAGAVMLRCERAPLLEEGPRPWAQQLGRQMNGGRDLLLWPVPQVESPVVERWKGDWVRHIVIRFELREWPEKISREGAPLVWSPENDFGRKASGTAEAADNRTSP